jgi:hypothetical protein
VVVQAPTGSGKTYIFELFYPDLKEQAVCTQACVERSAMHSNQQLPHRSIVSGLRSSKSTERKPSLAEFMHRKPVTMKPEGHACGEVASKINSIGFFVSMRSLQHSLTPTGFAQ